MNGAEESFVFNPEEEEAKPWGKHFFQIRGVPGAGKTTIALVIQCLNPQYVGILATDNFWDDGFDKERIEEAHQWCRDQTRELLEDGMPLVIVHNTAAEYYEMKDYQEMAEEHNYIYHRIIVEDHHGTGSTKEAVDEGLRDYMERKFQVRIKTP